MTEASTRHIRCHCGKEFDIEIAGYEFCPHCECMYTIDGNRAQIGKLESCSTPSDSDRADIWDSYYMDLLANGHTHRMQGTIAKKDGNLERAMFEYNEAITFFERAEKYKPSEAEPKLAIAEVSSHMWKSRDHIETVLKKVQEADLLISESRSEGSKDRVQYIYALCHLGLRNRETAKNHLRQALKINPEHENAAAILSRVEEEDAIGLKTRDDVQWKEAMNPYVFEDSVKFDVEYGGTEERAKSNSNALGCVKCLQTNPLRSCNNCGNEAYSFGIGQDGVVGLFCTKCKQGFTSWKCTCGTINPISSKTLLAKGKSGGCFIATAACGAVNSPEVLYLSAYRDDVLQTSTFGRMFIRFYYRVSPYMTDIISKSFIMRTITRVVVIRPTIFAIRFIRKLRS